MKSVESTTTLRINGQAARGVFLREAVAMHNWKEEYEHWKRCPTQTFMKSTLHMEGTPQVDKTRGIKIDFCVKWKNDCSYSQRGEC